MGASLEDRAGGQGAQFQGGLQSPYYILSIIRTGKEASSDARPCAGANAEDGGESPGGEATPVEMVVALATQWLLKAGATFIEAPPPRVTGPVVVLRICLPLPKTTPVERWEVLMEERRSRVDGHVAGWDVNICPGELAAWWHALPWAADGANEHGGALFVFDLDSTLIQVEVIDEIARLGGVYEEVARVTREAMEGRYDFGQSLRRRVALLKGLRADTIWRAICSDVPFTRGVRDLARFLKAHPAADRRQEGQGASPIRVAILSGGFINVAHFVKEELHFDEAHSNVLEVDSDGRFTGLLSHKAALIDAEQKEALLVRIAATHGIPHSRVRFTPAAARRETRRAAATHAQRLDCRRRRWRKRHSHAEEGCHRDRL